MTTVIILLTIVVFFFYMAYKTNKRNQADPNFQSIKANIQNKINAGKYLSGHPFIDKAVENIKIIPRETDLSLISGIKQLAIIKKEEIKNVLAEDASTMEKKVTVGRLLLTGVFAFALKKNKKNELAYVTIQWNDKRFDHETIFEFTGRNAMEQANTVRNSLIKNLQ